MINPHKVTDFYRNQDRLEEFLLFCVVAAGKTATIQAKKLDEFLSFPVQFPKLTEKPESPFGKIRGTSLRLLHKRLEKVKMGQYGRITRAFRALAFSGLDLRHCSVSDLEKISGIGPKTARFFILHTRPRQKLCVIDTHVLKFMREQSWTTLKSTPSKRRYEDLEMTYIEFLEKQGIKDFAQYDLDIWKKYTKTEEVING